MKITINEILFNIEIDESLLQKKLIPVLFLHGFTGSSLEWKFIFDKINPGFLPFAMDLIGHGETDSPSAIEHYSSEAISNQIDQMLSILNIKQTIICGYSMGGRAALTFYAHHPEKVIGLILESSTPGIEEPQLRNDRIKSDELLASKIEVEGVEKFGSYWLNLPLFESLKSMPGEEYRKILKSRIHNNPTGLKNSLKGFSTGSMPVLWETIRQINFPTLLITGEYDTKFSAINKRLNEDILKSEYETLKGCGHNTHLEKPEVFINLVNKYLNVNFPRDGNEL